MGQCSSCGTTKGRIISYKRKTDLCWSHYLQMRRHGRILSYTKYTPNEFIKRGKRVEIVIRQQTTGKELGRAFIDPIDLPRVQRHKWHLAKRKGRLYANTCSKVRALLHVFILGSRKGFEIDHINGDGLDCRRSNLRHLTHHGNILNRHIGISKSGRMGVTWRADRKCWVARIVTNGQAIHKHCTTLKEAKAIREAMERKYFGVTVADVKS